MKQEEFEEKPKKIMGTTKVPIETIILNPGYNLIPHPDTQGTKTGFIKIAELVPKDKTLPSFSMRWDHGAAVLDIDIYQNEKPLSKKTWSISGYEGHHTTIIDPINHKYKVDIKIPGRHIFEGIVEAGLLVGLNNHDEVEITEWVKIEIK